MRTRMMLAHVVLAAAMLDVSGCGQQGAPSAAVSQPEAASSDSPPEVAVTPVMEEILAKADALDGQSDKIVSLCASCALGMKGSSEHQLRVGKYTMNFCTDDCRQAFSADISKSVLGLKLPTADESGSP